MRNLLLLLSLLTMTACSLVPPREDGSVRATAIEDVLRKTVAVDDRIDKEHFPEDDGNPAQSLQFLWPVAVKRVFSPFGVRGGRRHEGIDVSIPTGHTVNASADGEVVYANDSISGYGLALILRHGRGFSTLYAHNSRLLVGPGDWVQAGEKIALSGATGRTTGPHLHFEIRRGTSPVDPEPWLDSMPTSATSSRAISGRAAEAVPPLQ